MLQTSIPRFRRLMPWMLSAFVLTAISFPGCGGGVEEGMLKGEQAPEITAANNAMEEFAKSRTKTKTKKAQ